MANIKISELTSATLPLGGGEELPIVQGGSTVKVEVSDMVTLQQIVSGNHDLVDGVNLQGTGAGGGNTGINVNAFGTSAAVSNTGDFVNAFGVGAASGNIGNEVNAFGSNAGNNNTHDNVTIFGTDTAADGPNQVVFGKNAGDEAMILDFDSLTLVRKYTYPDKSGIVALTSDLPPYTSYVAVISQSGTGAPTVDYVLQNTLGGALTFNYVSPGNYTVTNGASLFTNQKTIVFINPGFMSSGFVNTAVSVGWERNSSSTITIKSKNASNGTDTNDLIFTATIEIRVYS